MPGSLSERAGLAAMRAYGLGEKEIGSVLAACRDVMLREPARWTHRDVQRFLDRHILQHMVENNPGWLEVGECGFHLHCFTNEWVTRDMARALCRSLTDRGYCRYMRGLFTEDDEVAGAGYAITPKGVAYLDELLEEGDA